MASEEFKKYLASLSDEKKKELNALGNNVKSKTLSSIEDSDTNNITQHSTPNDTYQDAHRTIVPVEQTAPQILQRDNSFTQLGDTTSSDPVQKPPEQDHEL